MDTDERVHRAKYGQVGAGGSFRAPLWVHYPPGPFRWSAAQLLEAIVQRIFIETQQSIQLPALLSLLRRTGVGGESVKFSLATV